MGAVSQNLFFAVGGGAFQDSHSIASEFRTDRPGLIVLAYFYLSIVYLTTIVTIPS